MVLSRLLFEIPTGVVADLYSRRLSVVIGFCPDRAGHARRRSVPVLRPHPAGAGALGTGVHFHQRRDPGLAERRDRRGTRQPGLPDRQTLRPVRQPGRGAGGHAAGQLDLSFDADPGQRRGLDRPGRPAHLLDVGARLQTGQAGGAQHLPTHGRHLLQGHSHRAPAPGPAGGPGRHPVLQPDTRPRPAVGLAPGEPLRPAGPVRQQRTGLLRVPAIGRHPSLDPSDPSGRKAVRCP